MLLKLIAIIILLHGLIHLFGVVTFWKISLHEHYSTKVLGGVLDIGERGTYVLGFAWLVATAAYTIAAYGMFTDQVWWQTGLFAAAAYSLVLTVLGWKDAISGTILNLIILISLILI
ncbi:hypothetical protein [Methanococcoides sp. FTZ1]|uniref:hypothetical protein n=1 Tax=Methanococcoides sp. FTZ1 TaxID=3439061 RepID=UPI003F84E883